MIKKLEIKCKNKEITICFREFIIKTLQKYNAVILMDEHDKSMLNVIQAREHRGYISGRG